jgi:hypothetical protein
MTPASRTPGPEATTGTTGRRNKRPAPGPVSSGQDGGAAVSYGRRKAKPTKKRISDRDSVATAGDDYRIDEDGVLEEIDPNEPRYCLCGDVSFGTMICCENPDVSFSTPSFLVYSLVHFLHFLVISLEETMTDTSSPGNSVTRSGFIWIVLA